MTIDDKIRDGYDNEKQYDINREVGKLSPLSSDKIEKYKYLTGEKILPFDQSRMIEQAKFTYSPLVKALAKQIKKQIDSLQFLNLSNKTDELKQIEKSVFPKNQILLFEGKSVLSPAQRGTGSERVKFSLKNQKNVWLLLKLLQR